MKFAIAVIMFLLLLLITAFKPTEGKNYKKLMILKYIGYIIIFFTFSISIYFVLRVFI